MNVAIIGCGLIGRKRAEALAAFPEDRLVAACDTDAERAKALAMVYGAGYVDSFEKAVRREDVDIVIIATINSALLSITAAALRAGKHVLCEKPLGRNASEAREMVDVLKETRNSKSENRSLVLKTGFNHRFHPAILKAKEITGLGGIGKLLIIRARYGHGSRPGMEKEWRSSKELCGGGELLDQGVHVIDLIRWFGGEVVEAFGRTETKFWPVEVEDNAFALLTLDSGVTAQFHVSMTNWRNVFSMELFGSDGYLSIQGLGGSYGPETLEWGRRKKEGGRPDIETFEFPREDNSWKLEWQEFRSAIKEKREPVGSGLDGLRANEVVEALYRSSEKRSLVVL